MDIKTLFLCLIFINLFLTVFMLISSKIQKTYNGYKYWILSTFILSIAYIFFALRGIVSDFLSVVIANALASTVGVLRIISIRKFFALKTSNLYFISVPILSSIIFYFTFVINNGVIRNTIISLFLSSASSYMAYKMIKNIKKGVEALYIFNAIIFISYLTICIIRMISWIITPQSMLQSSFSNILYFISVMSLDIGWCIMIFAMNAQKINMEIQEKNKQLEELNKVKNKLFSVIGHDLRNPFNVILGFSNLLIEKIEKKEIYKMENVVDNVVIIRDLSYKTYILLENLLRWGKIQIEINSFKPDFYNLYEIIDANITFVKHIAEFKKINIIVDVDNSIKIYTDKDMLDTVIRNLLTNAIKFSFFNTEVKIVSEKKLKDVVLSVEDKGIGMSLEDIDKLFRIEELFTRRGTNNELGTGLGLILCKEYVEKNNGKIWVESEEGKGSCFKLLLKGES